MNIYLEKIPDHYVGNDVSVTIHSNTKGQGLAELIIAEIKKIAEKWEGKSGYNH